MANPTMRGYDSSYDYSVSFTQNIVIVQNQYTAAVKDVNVTYPPVYNTEYTAVATTGANTGPITYASPTGAFSVSGNLLISTRDNVLSTVVASAKYGNRNFKLRAGLNTQGVNPSGSFFSGSFASSVQSSMRSYYTGGATTDAFLRRYSSLTVGSSLATTSVTRNPTRVASGLDLSWLSVTGIPASNPSGAGEYFPLALIASRFALMAKHVAPSVGDIYTFDPTTGTGLVASTVQSVTPLTPMGSDNVDLVLVYFSQPRNDCSYVWFVPNEPNYLPGLSSGAYGTSAAPYGIPLIITLIQQPPVGPTSLSIGRKLLVLSSINNTTTTSYGVNANYTELQACMTQDSVLSPFTTYPITGDSSSVLFYPVTQGSSTVCALAAMLHGTLNQPGGGVGGDVSLYISQINTLMNQIAHAAGDATVYAVQQLNMQTFNKY